MLHCKVSRSELTLLTTGQQKLFISVRIVLSYFLASESGFQSIRQTQRIRHWDAAVSPVLGHLNLVMH